jgi:formate hydrogenlyase subunit 3/multisubunit Na+/H+ antiporter MnhD subunit
MFALILAFCCFFASGLAALITNHHGRVASLLGVSGPLAGAVLALIPACIQLFSPEPLTLKLPWTLPLGSFYLGLDKLSAFFLIPFCILIALTALYGLGYLKKYEKHKSPGVSWFFFNGLAASMIGVLLARNGLLFLICWEVMSITSFFLMTFENEKPEVRTAGLVYLVATHLGTLFLFVFFILMGQASQSLDFDKLAVHAPLFPTLLFCLAVVGFGTKAGLIPFHVWLPTAHPAAPSHVSALMSGVMVKTGIYGIIRTVMLLDAPSVTWGWILISLGLVSALMGVLLALAQRDIKKLLAYSTIENVGIMTLGIGMGIFGQATANVPLALLGWAGGLLHIFNHAMFKGLLFMGAGTIAQTMGTREIERMGGLSKRLRITGFAFLLGSLAIAGLPPFNGFISEFFIYLGAFKQVSQAIGNSATILSSLAPAFGILFGLSLAGGMAVVAFTKAFGIFFLGEPISDAARAAQEGKGIMLLPVVLLALCCLLLGLAAPLLPVLLQPVLSQLLPGYTYLLPPHWEAAFRILTYISLIGVGLLVLLGLGLLLRKIFKPARALTSQTVTWDCGYSAPQARMQYTATSFVQPLVVFFKALLQIKEKAKPALGLFPRQASLHSETTDLFERKVYTPLFKSLQHFLSRWHWLQHGRLQLYILYIALVLVILLMWKLG